MKSVIILFVLMIGTMTKAQENEVLVPNDKTVWLGGSKENIVWILNGKDVEETTEANANHNEKIGHKYLLQYSSDNGNSWVKIDDSVSVNKVYLWEIPNISSDLCQVKVSNIANLNVFVISKLFLIKKSDRKDVTILLPYYNDTLIAGEKTNISWVIGSEQIYVQFKKVNLQLSTDNGAHWKIIPVDTTDLKIDKKNRKIIYLWIVTDNNSNACLIKVSYMNSNIIAADTTLLFTIHSKDTRNYSLSLGSTFSFFDGKVKSNDLYDAIKINDNFLWRIPKLWILNYIFPVEQPIGADFSFIQGKSTSNDTSIIPVTSVLNPYDKKTAQNEIYITALTSSFNITTLIKYVYLSFYTEYRNLTTSSKTTFTLNTTKKDTTLTYRTGSNELYVGIGPMFKLNSDIADVTIKMYYAMFRATDNLKTFPYGFILKFNLGINSINVDLGGELRTDHAVFKGIVNKGEPRYSQLLVYLAKNFDLSKIGEFITK